jgi:hypothetical protein
MDAQNRNPAKTGRYTLEEAAIEILKGSGEINGMELKVVREERINTVVKRLKEAVANGSLTVYDPGSNIPRQPKIVREFFEVAHWDDLNQWLETSLPRINWEFPKPVPNPDEVKSDQNAAEQPTTDNNKDVDKKKWKPRSIELSLQLYADGMEKNDLAAAIKKELDSGDWINRKQEPVDIQSILKDGVHKSLNFERFGAHRKS